MSKDIIITIDDLAAKHGLEEIDRRLHNLRPAFASMGEYMTRRSEQGFKAERDPDGVPWAPLSAAYKKRKRGTKILTESGGLRSSVNYYVDDRQVVVGTNKKYARRQQRDRPFIGATQKDEQELGKILISYLNLGG